MESAGRWAVAQETRRCVHNIKHTPEWPGIREAAAWIMAGVFPTQEKMPSPAYLSHPGCQNVVGADEHPLLIDL